MEVYYSPRTDDSADTAYFVEVDQQGYICTCGRGRRGCPHVELVKTVRQIDLDERMQNNPTAETAAELLYNPEF